MTGLIKKALNLLDKISLPLAFLSPLLLRLYLAPLFWKTGWTKYESFENTVAWFGNPDWGLGLPFPELNAYMAVSAEIIGAACLLLGFATRLVCIPLMVTMIVAALTVHLKNGWQFIHDKASVFPSENIDGAVERLGAAKSILKEHGNYGWLTEHGSFVMSNNGIELVAGYFIMLLALFFLGSGKYFSVDYWLGRACCSADKK